MRRFLALTFILILVVVGGVFAQDERPPYPPDDPYKAYYPIVVGGGEISGNGLAWAGVRQPNDPDILSIDWFFVWSIQKSDFNPGGHFDDLVYVPYFSCDTSPPYAWGQDVKWRSFDRLYAHYPPDYRGIIMFLNEPDLPGDDEQGQCENTPKRGFYMYKQLVEEYPNAIIVGPAVSHLDYIAGWEWLERWYNLVEAAGLPKPEYSAIHTYIGNQPAQRIIDSHFELLSNYTNAPTRAWVTEFGNCDPMVVANMVDTFQVDSRITAWAYFAPRVHHFPGLECLSLFTDNTGYNLTAVGEAYLQALQNPLNQPQWIGWSRTEIELEFTGRLDAR